MALSPRTTLVSRLFGWFQPALEALAVGSCGPAASPAALPAPFVLEEATIAGIHAAFAFEQATTTRKPPVATPPLRR